MPKRAHILRSFPYGRCQTWTVGQSRGYFRKNATNWFYCTTSPIHNSSAFYVFEYHQGRSSRACQHLYPITQFACYRLVGGLNQTTSLKLTQRILHYG